MNPFPWLVLPVLFIGMWAGSLFVFSRLGWSELASVYRAEQPFKGRRWHWVSARVGRVSWGSSLTMGANGEGLFLAPMIFIRFAHPALFIPWSDITAVWKRWFGFQCVQLTARGAANATIFVWEPQARAMALAAGAAWPAPDLRTELELRRVRVDRGRTALAYASVGTILFSGCAAGFGSANVPRYWKLDRAGEHAAARVTSVEPEYHNFLRYAYTVRGTRYEGIGSIDDAGRAPIRPGDPVTIRYLPAYPAASCLGDPHALLINELKSAGTAAALLAMLDLFVLLSFGFAIRRPSIRSR